jgi:hypothetical protein
VKKVLKRWLMKAITVLVGIKDVDKAVKKVCASSFKGMILTSYFTTERYIQRLRG